MTEPNFMGWIPAPVRYHKDISASAKLMFCEISAMTKKEGYCWATNKYFSDLFNTKPETISEWIRQLVKARFVRIDVDPAKGNERKIWIMEGLPINQGRSSEKTEEGSSDKSEASIYKNGTSKKEPQLFEEQKSETLPFVASLQTAWNSCEHLPKIRAMSAGRAKKIKLRMKDTDFAANYPEAIKRICNSRFCRGENDRKWVADIDWFLQPDSFVKIMEGKYDDRGPSEDYALRKLNGMVGMRRVDV